METNQAGDRVLTQWFERARFEWHPDRPAEYRVLLGLLGREFWGAQPRPNPSFQAMPAALDERAAPALPTATPAPSPTRFPTWTPEPTDVPAATASPTPAAPTTAPTHTASPTLTPTLTPTPSSTATEATPTPTRTTLPTTDSSDDGELKQRLLELIEMHHQAAGCPAFIQDARLTEAAQAHADDIAFHQRIDHVGTDGATLRDRLRRAGYPYERASEGIAVYKTPEIAVDFWMDEPPDGPHRQNITNCQYTDIGIGLAYDARGWRWWVMDVANRRPGS
jgi:uncharacterized protein YkwD